MFFTLAGEGGRILTLSVDGRKLFSLKRIIKKNHARSHRKEAC